MKLNAQTIVANLLNWASRQSKRPRVFVFDVVGFDPLQDLATQLQRDEATHDWRLAMSASQERSITSSRYGRKILDALDEGRLEEAERLVRAQVWPCANVTTERSEMEEFVRRAMKLGEVEVDFNMLRPGSEVAEVSLIAQGWRSSKVGRAKGVPVFTVR